MFIEAYGFSLGLQHDPYICLVASVCCVCNQASVLAPILVRYVQVNWQILCSDCILLRALWILSGMV